VSSPELTVQQQSVGIQDNLVPTGAQHAGDIPSRLQLSELQETLVGLDGVADQFGRSGFSLSSDDNGLLQVGGGLDIMVKYDNLVRENVLPSPEWPGLPRRQLAEQFAVRPAWLWYRRNDRVSDHCAYDTVA
jgi:hypothetical protein